jgi:hypothetical protein
MLLKNTSRRDGTVVIAAAFSMVAILACVALSVDGGMALDTRRQSQAVADAAALAAAGELYATCFTKHGLDPDGTIAALARRVATDNGYEDGVNGVTVDVFIPPQTGPFAGQPGHAEVVISTEQDRHFSTIYGSRDPVRVGFRAVARGTRNAVRNGIIVLNPTAKGALSSGGGAGAAVGGSASVIVNSNNSEAMIANGGGSLSAPQFDVSASAPGYATPGGGQFVGTINTGVEPTPDPLRFIPAPDPSTMTVQSTKKLQFSSANSVTLQPGVYIGGVSISGKGSVILAPGVYYMQGGGFTFGGQGSLTGSGVMIYNDPSSNSDNINLTGQGAVNLTPPTSGPYQGISLFQRRSGDPQPPLNITGNGTAPMYITGTFYAAGALLNVTGNGSQDTIGSQYISDTLSLGGNGTFNVNWDPQLVPGIRQIWLVE